MYRNRRILIVEDERVLAMNLSIYLARRFDEVRVAQSGEEALSMSESFKPDVVVLDYGLHGMNGVQTYSQLKRRCTRPLGCVMITGYPPEMIARAARERGICRMLCKPFPLSDLQDLVELSADNGCCHLDRHPAPTTPGRMPS